MHVLRRCEVLEAGRSRIAQRGKESEYVMHD